MTTFADAYEILHECFRGAFHREPQLPTSVWADRHRIITLGDKRGPWDTNVVPYSREIMDCFGTPGVRQITLEAAAQTSKTEILNNMLFKAIDQRPGLAMWVYPNEKVAQKQNRLRLLPAAEKCKPIARRFKGASEVKGTGGTARAKTGLLLTFDRMSVSFVGSNSPANLEGLPCLYVFVDEVDRCHPETMGLVRERVKAYPFSHVIVVAGTPGLEGEGIDGEFLRGDRRRYLVPCPHCGVYHRRLFSRLRWPRGEHQKPHEADEVQAERHAYYVCPECKQDVLPEHLRAQLARGVWCPEGCTVAADGSLVGDPPQTDHRSYHLPGLLSGLVANPCGYVARSYIRLKGAMDQNFVTRVLGDPYQVRGDGLAPASLRNLIPPVGEPGSYLTIKPMGTEWGTAPADVLAVTAEVDVQPRHAWAALRGWGEYGRESWLLWYGKIDLPVDDRWIANPGAIDALLARRIRTADGRLLRVKAAAIDSGHRAHDVYDYCRPHLLAGRMVYPVKGASTSLTESGGAPVKHSLLDASKSRAAQEEQLRATNPNAIVPVLLLIDTGYYKSSIFGKLGGVPDLEEEAGASVATPTWHLPSDVSDDYLAQITAERQVRIKVKSRRFGTKVEVVWQLKAGQTDNHYGDGAVYGAGLGEYLNVRALRRAASAAAEPAPAQPVAPVDSRPASTALQRARQNPSAYLQRAREKLSGGSGLVP
jgi:phage terminase large subunit GpA-like protein